MSLISHARRIAFARTAKANLRQVYVNASRFCWNQADLQAAIAKTVYDHPDWSRIGSLYQSEIMGYLDCLHDIHLASLEQRYHINDRWYLPTEVGKVGNPDYSEARHDNCHFVYIVTTPNGPEFRIFA